jgi:hypothetical protein
VDAAVTEKPKPIRYSAELRAQTLAVVRAQPGLSAYTIGTHLPVPRADPGQYQWRVFPMTTLLKILADLAKDGHVYAVPNPAGQQFHPTEREDTDDDVPPF